MMKNTTALFLLALLLTGCARASTSTPALWKVSDSDNSLYLLGSFHFLKPGDYPLSNKIEAAMQDAENLLFELAPQEMQSPELSAAMIKAGLRQDAKQLDDDLSPVLQKKLNAWAAENKNHLAKLGLSAELLQRFEPWYVGMLIGVIELQKQGLRPELGLDNHFIAKAQTAGKPGAGLELGAEQIALFDGMSHQQQIQFLDETLADSSKSQVELERLHAAWRRGDVNYMWQQMALPMRKQYPELYRRINSARNDAWIPKLQQRLNTPGTDDTLVVVGALHLIGEDGVVEKLRAKGYRVERLQ
jgi:uncharacterized protein YbaP (TraB family)